MLTAATNVEEIAATVLLDIAVIALVARLMGALSRRLHQPAVIGEILAGLALGPTLLGALPGNLTEHLFPIEVRPFLRVVADLGLVIFMFIVGLELDLSLLRGKRKLAVGVSASSVALPFALGLGLAAALHGSHGVVDGDDVDFVPFALFIGASMSVTAFPVLARILSERGLHRIELGALALACAAVDDVLAWSLLAVVLAVVSSSSISHLPLVLAESVAFVAVIFLVVRPLLERVADRHRAAGRLSPDLLAAVLIGLLLSSYVTSKIGIHAIFGAFLFGTAMPRRDTAALFHDILERLEQVSVLLLLPVFFIVTGLSADVGALGGRGIAELGLVLLVACSGKFLGAFGAARALGVRARKAGALGVLMNTRGLTELVILNVGLQFGVLDGELFTILVVMAIVTTVMTGPLLRLLYPDDVIAREVAEAELEAMGDAAAHRIVVAFVDADTAPALVADAIALVADERPAEIVLTHLPSVPPVVEVGAGLGAELLAVADAMAALEELQRPILAAGVACVTSSRFSADPVGDIRAVAAIVGVDAVVVPAGLADALGHLACASIAVAADGPSEPASLCAVVGDAADGWAAAEQAARLSRGRGIPLALVGPARFVRATADRLHRAGIDAVIVADPPPDARTVGGPGCHVVVRAGDGDAGDSFERFLTGIVVPA